MGPELNLIEEREFLAEIGITGIKKIAKLGFWLNIQNEGQLADWESRFDQEYDLQAINLTTYFQLPARFAPSLVCRSEVELFGRSTPRFAMRIRRAEDPGFINIRRLATLSGQLMLDSLVDGKFIDMVLQAPCVADAFLMPPEWATDGYHVIKVPLAKACGEIQPEEDDNHLVPYVRHMKTGGGMCAQAVSFMANALHTQIDAAMHGLPEVTLIASRKRLGAVEKIEFDGLFIEEISDYFNSEECGKVCGQWQSAKLHFDNISKRVLYNRKNDIFIEFQAALTAYAFSDVPVILPVDVGRMQGIGSGTQLANTQPSVDGIIRTMRVDDPLNDIENKKTIYRRNGLLPFLNDNSPDENRSHVVIVVGCTEPDAWAGVAVGASASYEELFLFNDPANYPFMIATAQELLIAGCYADKAAAEASDIRELSFGRFLPITARQVKMPFLDEAYGAYVGIFTISAFLQGNGFSYQSSLTIDPKYHGNDNRGKFRLFQFSVENLLAHTLVIFNSMGVNHDAFGESAFITELRKLSFNSWCWLEVNGTNVFIWNAEATVTKEEIVKLDEDLERTMFNDSGAAAMRVQEQINSIANRVLFAVYSGAIIESKKNFALSCGGTSASQPATGSEQQSLEGKLSPSIISSFNVVRKKNELDLVPAKIPIEFYVLMQSYADKLLMTQSEKIGNFVARLLCKFQKRSSELNPKVHPCALELMARSKDDKFFVDRIAKYILGYERKVVALATYLPSLSAGIFGPDPNNIRKNKALDALIFVLRVAKKLQQHSDSDRYMVVEVVAGSRVIARIDQDDQTHFAFCMKRQKAIGNIVDCLQEIILEIKDTRIRIAFEFEPSTCCALGKPIDVEEFCGLVKMKEQAEPAWKQIGVNLDIAHWGFIEKIRPMRLPPVVLERIFHAHISSHGSGHWADGPLEDGSNALRSKHDYLEWFLLLESLTESGVFSGFVSLELESVKDCHMVTKSLGKLERWLGT